MDKSIFKMSPVELQNWLHARRRSAVIENKKGKGSYTRKEKYKKDLTREEPNE